MIIKFFEKIGRFIIRHLETLGQFTILIGNTVAQLRYPPRIRHIFQQMSHLGVDTLPIIALTMLFTGMVITLPDGYRIYSFRCTINSRWYSNYCCWS